MSNKTKSVAKYFIYLSVLSASIATAKICDNQTALQQTQNDVSLYSTDPLVFKNSLNKKIEIIGRQNLVIDSENNGMVNKSNKKTDLTIGTTFYAKGGPVTIIIPQTGQKIILDQNSEIQLAEIFTDKTENIKCMYAFSLLKGSVTMDGNHNNHCVDEKKEIDLAEIHTDQISITPLGTKYSVDLNQAVAEMNGEKYDDTANVKIGDDGFKSQKISVEKGSVAIKLRKVKPSKNIKVTYNDDDYDEDKIVLKPKAKAKTKKGKKDRVADIEIVYPQD